MHAALAAAAACHDASAPAPAPLTLRIVDGDGQRGTPGQPLGAPLELLVLDDAGAPLAGVEVAFAAADGGAVEPATVRTGPDGRARARWTLGTPAGSNARAVARAELAGRRVEVVFVAHVGATPGPEPLRVLPLATYDGSGQVVHPDVLADGGRHAPAWPDAAGADLLAITPYPGGDAGFENPALYVGSALAWRVPDGLANPLVRPAAGHLSDPDLVRDPATGRLRLYYREASDRNRVWLVESADGRTWGAPRLVVEGPNHTVLSPAVVRAPDGTWRMWAVDGRGGCSADRADLTVRRSADGVTWSAPERAALDQPGVFPWHVDVQWLPSRGEYWALFNGKTAGSCATGALWLATSADGVRWRTYPSPVLARGAVPAFADVVYRASFAYDAAADLVTLWHSGARYAGGRYVWSAATERRPRADLLAAVLRPRDPGLAPAVPPPPLTEFP